MVAGLIIYLPFTSRDYELPDRRVSYLPKAGYSILGFCALIYSVPAGAELDLEYRGDELGIEPTVQVKEHENRTVEEYRINGNLYMVKIKPRYGPAYYLVDDTGTGELEWRRDAAGRDMLIPKWTLMTW